MRNDAVEANRNAAAGVVVINALGCLSRLNWPMHPECVQCVSFSPNIMV